MSEICDLLLTENSGHKKKATFSDSLFSIYLNSSNQFVLLKHQVEDQVESEEQVDIYPFHQT